MLSKDNHHCVSKGLLGVAIVTVAALLIPQGCGGKASSSPPTTRPSAVTSAGKSGAQLWEQSCMRCHNLRSPETYSDAQWELAVHHMRLRANLTGEEQRKITAFLKAAN